MTLPNAPRRAWPVLGAVTALLVAVATGLVLWADGPAGPAARSGRAPGAASPDPAGATPVDHLERTTRTARTGTASLVLPEDPYRVHPDPIPLDGVLDHVFWAAAPVHPRYDGRHDWSSAVLLGRLSAPAGTGELEQHGRRAVEGLSTSFFGDLPTQVRRLDVAEHAVDGHPGVLVTASVHYSAPNLPSRADRVTALLVRLGDGSVVLGATAVPEDADPALARQAAAALGTLTVR